MKLNKIKKICTLFFVLANVIIGIAANSEEQNTVNVRIIQSKLEYNANNHAREYLLGLMML